MPQPNRTTTIAPPAPAARDRPLISPVLPLLLLETMRDMDRPEEVLEDEDLAASLPRRFGLSDVVFVQIRRFQEEVRQKRLQRVSDVEDLIRLVVRRPDASAIFLEAGRRVARNAWQQRARAVRGGVRFLPNPLALVSATRAARKLLRRMSGSSPFRVQRWPIELRIDHSLTARADATGAACSLYTGAFEETLRLYTGRAYHAHHTACATRGDDACEWQVRLGS
jgi:predicted hydrocarbon binding protein